jgi:hypothetical protein
MMKKIFAPMLFCFAFASQSFAAVDLTGFTVDTATPESLAVIILGGLAVLWGIRKLIKMTNRS